MRLNIKLLDKNYEKYYNTKKNYDSDSGFDLYVIEDTTIEPWQVGTIKSGVTCAPFVKVTNMATLETIEAYDMPPTSMTGHSKFVTHDTISGYYLYPRSSISKTPLMLANSVGIIDSQYRGELLAKVRNLSNEPYTVTAGTSLFQICAPDLRPFTEIKFVEELNNTQRGSGGFGSTNKTA